MTQEQDWKRLGEVVRQRRERMGLTQQQVAAKGGPSTATMRQIEAGLPGGYRASTLYGLEEVLIWVPGTCMGVVRGEVVGRTGLPFEEWIDQRLINTPVDPFGPGDVTPGANDVPFAAWGELLDDAPLDELLAAIARRARRENPDAE